MNEHRAAIFAFLLVVASCVSVWYFFFRSDEKASSKPALVENVEPKLDSSFDPNAGLPEEIEELVDEQTDIGFYAPKPKILLEQFAMAVEEDSWEELIKILGKDALPSGSLQELRKLIEQPNFRLEEDPYSEIGESRVNRSARWSLNIDSKEPRRIFLDLEREDKGWKIKGITLPGEKKEEEIDQMTDALGVADAFIQNALQQRFGAALGHADLSVVSDAKVAGLCILFEEGEYHLRKRKPLRAVYNREANAGFLANVETKEGENAAQFGLNLKKNANGEWKVAEVVLDSLLADYAQRVEQGDVYYSPLTKNPEGGDTLVIYFEFDEDGLTNRMKRQLNIMATVLRFDREKKIVLTGHADALGSDDYNKELSEKRAMAVKAYLNEQGVQAEQINIIAAGEANPRRPNVRADGTDDPTARRVNRRTEIYLDF